MTEVINISAKLFKVVTKEDCTLEAIRKHKGLLTSRIKHGEGKKVCIVDTEGKDHWFDHQLHPTAPGKRKYPSVAKQVMNVSAAAVKAFNNFSATGRVNVNEEERERRLDICRTCEKFDAAKTRCTLCGCNMPLKTRLLSSTCPHPEGDKWELAKDGQ